MGLGFRVGMCLFASALSVALTSALWLEGSSSQAGIRFQVSGLGVRLKGEPPGGGESIGRLVRRTYLPELRPASHKTIQRSWQP